MRLARTLPNEPAPASSQPLVIPVRYLVRGEVVHATSTQLTVDDIHVRSALPPHRGAPIELKLYVPQGGGIIRRPAVVAEIAGTVFRARFDEADEGGRQRISELLWQREMRMRPWPRYHAHLQVALQEEGRPPIEGLVTNLSRSGAFVKLDRLPAQGMIVDLQVRFPGETLAHTVHCYVVHLAPRRGAGIQFIGAGEEFQQRLEAYLAELAG